jgi:hypothetical protein
LSELTISKFGTVEEVLATLADDLSMDVATLKKKKCFQINDNIQKRLTLSDLVKSCGPYTKCGSCSYALLQTCPNSKCIHDADLECTVFSPATLCIKAILLHVRSFLKRASL